MHHRGVTLLELLIVIALLLGAAALVLPALGRQLSERTFESACADVEAACLLARAEAMRSGRAIELRWDAQASALVSSEFDPAAVVDDDMRREEAPRDFHTNNIDWLDADPPADLIPFEELDNDDGGPFVINSLRLPEGVLPVRTQPQVNDAGEHIPPVEEKSFRVVVYLGDGSALLARTVWLTDEASDSSLARLEINPWTGVPGIERVAAVAADELADHEGSEDPGFTLEAGDETQ